jgi:hypothetical protein
MVRNEDILKDILLKMRYDSSKTLNENIQEQGLMQNGALMGTTTAPSDSDKEMDELIRWRNEYPNQCSHKNKALMPQPVGNLSVKESMIKGFCLYPVPASEPRGGTSGLWIPAASDMYFYDMSRLKKLIDTKIEERNNGSTFFSGLTDQQIQKVIMDLFPLGTVSEFTVGDSHVSGAIHRVGGLENNYSASTLQHYTYKGMYYYPPVNGMAEPYIQPKRDDSRSDWEYFLDEYGFWAQIGTAVLFAAVSIATGGAGGLLLLAAEIAVEGTLGYMIASREWDKGNTAAGWFELIFGLTPLLKGTKLLRGVSHSQVKAIANKMKAANLPLKASADELMTFYRTLTETEQEIFSKMLKDVTDEVTEGTLKQALGKGLVDELYVLVKKNPEMLKSVEWWKKVVAKEGMVNGALVITQVGYESFYGEPLSEQQKEQIKGIYTIIPERLGNQLGQEAMYQLSTNPENTKKLIEHADEIGEKLGDELMSTRAGKEISPKIKDLNAKRTERIMAEHGIQIDLNVDSSVDDNVEDKQSETLSAVEIRKQGWKLSIETAINSGGCEENNIESQEFNDRTYYRCKV